MNGYILVSKQSFTSLYRFGQIPINPSDIIFAENEDSNFQTKLLQSLVLLPSFEGDEEYLILKFECIAESSKLIYIQELLEIIPLTMGAKKSYELKFDPRLNFSDARFENVIQHYEEQIDIKDRIQGINAVCKILLPSLQSVNIIESNIIETAYFTRIRGKKSSEINEEFFTHLLVYERYEFFPKSDLGYFYDIGEIFAHSKQKQTFKGSGFYTFLESKKKEINTQKLSSIIDFVETSSEIELFKNQLFLNNSKRYISGVLFLKFKDELNSRDSIWNTKIPDIAKWIISKGVYINEIQEAVSLLGAFFGYKKFYDDFYEISGLRVFRPNVGIKHQNKVVPFKEPLVEENRSLIDTDEQIKGLELEKKSITKETLEITNKINPETNLSNSINPSNKKSDQVLLQIKSVIGSHETKVEKGVLQKLKEIIKPISKSRSLTKDNVIKIITETYPEEIEVSKKTSLKVRTETSLFPKE